MFDIARGIQKGDRPFQLRFVSLVELRTQLGMELGIDGMPDDLAIAAAESGLITRLKPTWNRS